jgi:hypothetical protein
MPYALSPLHPMCLSLVPCGLLCSITARLVIDSMGHMSPITRQCRWGERPDGICMVVGSCASGFDPARNTHGDLLYSNTPILDKGQTQIQYFWEAFPASSGPSDRTTYVRTYTHRRACRMAALSPHTFQPASDGPVCVCVLAWCRCSRTSTRTPCAPSSSMWSRYAHQVTCGYLFFSDDMKRSFRL